MDSITLRRWVDRRAKSGLYCFTKDDIKDALPKMKQDTIRISLHRLRSAKRIISPWRNFYMAVPEEYALKGEVPQNLYIDQMMRFIGKDYYVCLLNAAALHGASHQAVMTFSVMTSTPSLGTRVKKETHTNFYSRLRMPDKYLVQRKTKTGLYNVSSPELTALDLVARYHDVGGLNRVAVVMSELVEKIDANKFDKEMLSYFPVSDVQRLGYILDCVLGETKIADALYELSKSKFRKAILKISKGTEGAEMNDKWKIMVNDLIEVEE